jgi:hypothetical protein
LAHLGAFTVGVMTSERIFGEAAADPVEPGIQAVWRDEISGIKGELGRVNDAYLGLLARRLLFGDRGSAR